MTPKRQSRTRWGGAVPLVARKLGAIALLVVLGGLLSATLVRMAPGFDADERELDPSLSADSVRALRDARRGEHNIVAFYAGYLRHALRGDLGTSHALGQPVQDLLRERWPVTARVAGEGLLLAWLLASMLAFTACLWRLPAYEVLGTTVSGAFLCIPAAVLALLSVILNAPGYLAVALIVFPKIYLYSRNLLAKAYALPHLTAARARGVGEIRLLAWHALPVAGPQMIALAGVTVSIALGASIPVEALCGLPGIGQLAWQAALSRDLPLLVNLTVLVTLVTLLANSAADVMNYVLQPHQA
ncbi:MAG: ABC transporter permease [Terriglobales bacterium]|jgi:peptide/nickel transport system permease protein